jgi:hypothetical protein
MNEIEKKKTKLVIYSITGFLVVTITIYARIFIGNANPIDYIAGMTLGVIIGIIINGIKQEYQDYKKVLKIKNQIQ